MSTSLLKIQLQFYQKWFDILVLLSNSLNNYKQTDYVMLHELVILVSVI